MSEQPLILLQNPSGETKQINTETVEKKKIHYMKTSTEHPHHHLGTILIFIYLIVSTDELLEEDEKEKNQKQTIKNNRFVASSEEELLFLTPSLAVQLQCCRCHRYMVD